MSRLRTLSQAILRDGGSHTNITPAPDSPWSAVGIGTDTLRGELEELYWQAVRGELENIIRNVKLWHEPELASIVLTQESPEDEFVHGFNTFIDQVSHEARAFAFRQGKRSPCKLDRAQVPM